MKLSNATKTRRAVIKDASEMHTFLTETNKDVGRIFELVKHDDLQPFLEEFDGVKVSTLSGTCTRSLHQIKASNQNGYLLQRPFSCFCTNCMKDDFENCDKKSFTKGKFIKHKLPSNDLFNNYMDDDAEEENEDVIEKKSNGYFEFYENEDEEVIESEKQNLQLDQLKPDDYVIVALESESKKKGIREFVAKINAIEGEEEISIDYLEKDLDYSDKFRNSDKINDVNQGIELCDIIMLLPKPKYMRGGVIFPMKINLKQT